MSKPNKQNKITQDSFSAVEYSNWKALHYSKLSKKLSQSQNKVI